MTTPLRLAASIATIAVVGVAALNLFGPVGGIGSGPPASPSATTSPTAIPTPAASPVATADPLVTSAWTPYTSSQYGFSLAYPNGWTAVPATRAWAFETDAGDLVLTPAADSFDPPARNIRVSTWAVPLEPGTTIESTEDIAAWIAAYCEQTGSHPCTDILSRATPFCLEKRDCHPALLVPFNNDVQAFFSGGIYDADAMNVVSVWRPESFRAAEQFGGTRGLLEAFLSTMDVWPAP
jgi:hypothetical protein